MLRITKKSFAIRVLALTGLCGELPAAVYRVLDENYDHQRRIITELVREGYLREWKVEGQKRHVIRSLCLTTKGLEKVDEFDPYMARIIREKRLSAGYAHGERSRALRLHRSAWCFCMAQLLGAYWVPDDSKEEKLGKRPVYYTAYELNQMMGWDNKGSRLSGVFIDACGVGYLFYYFGETNLLWNRDIEFLVKCRATAILQGPDDHLYPKRIEAIVLFGKDWSLAESLVNSSNSRMTRLFHLNKWMPCYYTTTDQNGLRIASLIVDSDVSSRFDRWLSQCNLATASFQEDYLFEISNLARFHPAPNSMSLDPPWDGLFLYFQKDIAEKLNTVSARIRTIDEIDWGSIWVDLEGFKRMRAIRRRREDQAG